MSYPYAVVHHDPPEVYAAEDAETLHRILALEVVAATPATSLSAGQRDLLRTAVLEERWGDAVTGWIDATGCPIDVYDSGLKIWGPGRFAERDITGLELQLRPLFNDDLA